MAAPTSAELRARIQALIAHSEVVRKEEAKAERIRLREDAKAQREREREEAKEAAQRQREREEEARLTAQRQREAAELRALAKAARTPAKPRSKRSVAHSQSINPAAALDKRAKVLEVRELMAARGLTAADILASLDRSIE